MPKATETAEKTNETAEKPSFARKYVYPKVTDAQYAQIEELCLSADLDINLGPYAAYDGKIHPTFAGYLMMAHQTGEFAGIQPTDFGPDILVKINGTEYFVPINATATVLRRSRGGSAPDSYSATVSFVEYAHSVAHAVNPVLFLDKWALAVALRRAFTDAIGNQVTVEEMQAGMQFDHTKVHKIEVLRSDDEEPAKIDLADELDKVVEDAANRWNAKNTESDLIAKVALAELFGSDPT